MIYIPNGRDFSLSRTALSRACPPLPPAYFFCPEKDKGTVTAPGNPGARGA
ncbi:hypothetical protein SAMN04487891_102464 [Flagellimonas taeanensis]|uniref:Uncharacterized protein n=1 Tax=Flagellimonas taeanensis TaxID=1005926 RepID=A0A1M6SIF7_9FLAO|nr:hypothetical protein SAMN04487891_102464 [Allomuricauda taeanensis]SHK44511.1 hypothetical protein SAMN05216293_1145 [Allomuricauda taeanensis]